MRGARQALAAAGVLAFAGIGVAVGRGYASSPADPEGADSCQRTAPLSHEHAGDVPVRWTSPANPQDREALAPWCRAVGPALVGAVPAHGEPERVDTFAVVSWNQHVGTGDLRRLVADLRSGALTGGTPVDQFVLLLQEVYREGEAIPPHPGLDAAIPEGFRAPPPDGSPRQDVRSLAQSLGLALFYAPSMRNGVERPGEAAEDRGNAILSTMRLDSLQVVTLPFERQRRAGLVAVLQIPSGVGATAALRVASLHLDVWPALLPSLLDGRRRIRQSAAFASALESGDTPVVVGADLNSISAGDPQVRYFRARWPALRPPTRCRSRGLFCPDHLFAGDTADWDFGSYRILPDRYGSDHHPLVAIATRRPALSPAR